MNPTSSTQTAWSPRGLFQCSTGMRRRADAARRLARTMVVILFALVTTPSHAYLCPVRTYRISVVGLEGSGWFLKAEAVPEREAMKVEREIKESTTVLKVMFSARQPPTRLGKDGCSWEPQSFLLSAQKAGKTLQYRVRIPEDVEPEPGPDSKFVYRSRVPLVMASPSPEPKVR